MEKEKQFHVGVKAMVENAHGQILLMHEDVSNHSLPTSEYWDLPGGRMQVGESVVDTLKREVAEETGIVKITKPKFFTAVISNHEIKLKNGELVGLVLMVYIVSIPLYSQVTLSHEHLDFEWVDKAEAAKRLSHKYPPEFTQLLV
jgi:8-oxo-dGTP diphosphatase